MVDMNTLERQLADESLRIVGPSHPVDDAAIFTAITTTQPPKWRFPSMFSATKFVVAGAIVALFGGFLLAGVLTTQPSDESMPAVGAPAPTVEATGDSEPTPEDRADEPTDLTALPGTFSRTGSLAEARAGHTATLLPDGRVLVAGGGREGSHPTEQSWEEITLVEAWDPATETFGSAGSLADGRSAHTATLLPDGRVLVIGGDVHHDDGVLRPSEAVAWDPATETFSPAGSTAKGRAFHTATLLPDARVLVVGGYDGRATQHASAEVWDPATETFSPTGSLTERRGRHTATLLPDGRVLVVGGYGSPFDENVGSAEIWDPATETFAPAGTLERSRQGHVAALLPDGRVLIAGGQYIHTDPDGGGGNRIVATAEVWDPETESFSPAGALAGGGGDTATILSDGRVLVVGGCCDDAYQALASAEIWDPLVGSFVPAASLADARIGHTATLLADGRVLVVGGEGATDPYIFASAEVWEMDSQQRPVGDVVEDASPPEATPDTGSAAEDQTASAASTTSDLLPGVDLVTEEVEPGVYRVVSDGVSDLSDLPDLDVPIEVDSDGECRGGFLVEGECWFNAYGMLVREVDGEFPIEQVPDAEHGLTFPAQEVIGPLPGSDDTGWLVITGPTGFHGLLGYGPQGWTRVPYAADDDGRAPSIETGGGCGVVLGPNRYPGLVGPDGTAWVYTLEREGLHVTGWDGDSWSSFGPVDISTPDVEDPCLLLDAAFGPNGTMWFTTRRIPLYVITPEAVAEAE